MAMRLLRAAGDAEWTDVDGPEWLAQFVYEIVMMRHADRLASETAFDDADWRAHGLAVESALVHVRILDGFLGDRSRSAVPVYAPFGSAADCVPGFTPCKVLTDAELDALNGTLGRFGSFSSVGNPWDVSRVVERVVTACLELANALSPADAALVLEACR
jgi:hypothetical protein